MKTYTKRIGIETSDFQDIVNINGLVKQAVDESEIGNGMVFVITMHTTTGITVNEDAECIRKDILSLLKNLVPDEGSYRHARYLDFDGRLGVNAPSHLRSVLAGNHTLIPLQDGKLVIGQRQSVFFLEFDGPQYREFTVSVVGED
ncbi:MAG: secondary thiamine-phosphate synthase enzyme YjbQ [Promethearchaeati archaeon SRVP18_Atabeyarchaeia-1]